MRVVFRQNLNFLFLKIYFIGLYPTIMQFDLAMSKVDGAFSYFRTLSTFTCKNIYLLRSVLDVVSSTFLLLCCSSICTQRTVDATFHNVFCADTLYCFSDNISFSVILRKILFCFIDSLKHIYSATLDDWFQHFRIFLKLSSFCPDRLPKQIGHFS